MEDHACDGIEGLKEAHRKAFKSYLRHGVTIERLSPKLLDYNLDKLADALDPRPTSTLNISASRPCMTAT